MHLLTMNELMAFLKVKRNTVYQLRRLGLPVIHLGRTVRFDREEVIGWIRGTRSATTAATLRPAACAAGDASVVDEGGSDFLL